MPRFQLNDVSLLAFYKPFSYCKLNDWSITDLMFYLWKQPPEVIYKKTTLLKIQQNSLGNTSARASFLINLQAEACNSIKKKKKSLGHRCFLVNFAKFLRTPFLQNISRRLLLYLMINQEIFYLLLILLKKLASFPMMRKFSNANYVNYICQPVFESIDIQILLFECEFSIRLLLDLAFHRFLWIIFPLRGVLDRQFSKFMQYLLPIMDFMFSVVKIRKLVIEFMISQL